MSARSNHNSVIKEACLLTNASWGAFVYFYDKEWRIKFAFKFPVSGRKDFRFLLKQKFPIHISGDDNSKSGPIIMKLPGNSTLACQYLFIFHISDTKLLAVGSDALLETQHKQIWKIVSKITESNYAHLGNDEFSFLQNQILELQLNKQELEARINAQREAEAGLVQTAKLAAVGEMAAGVAHELNNPLTSIVGFTELALDELPDKSDLRQDLELVLKEALRARKVVKSLLDFARQSETIRVKVDINEIVADVLMLTRHFMTTNDVKLDTHLGENLRWIFVDINQIKQVVINLVNNALYAMPNGGKILIETKEQSRYGRPWLTLAVKDTGIGIPPENLERIFEPFFTTRGNQGGTGLGLSVTFGIVTDHGGMIDVESELQVGSTFMVWLPLDQAE